MIFDRELLGRLVRRVWYTWAREQPVCKKSWIVPWEDLPEPYREVDRRIGQKVAEVTTEIVARKLERAEVEIERLKAEADELRALRRE